MISQNFSVLFIGCKCIASSKNKYIQKDLEKARIVFKKFHQNFDEDFNENSNNFYSDSEELFLIQKKHIGSYFEFLLNQLLKLEKFEIISENEFYLSKKITYHIDQNQKQNVETLADPVLSKMLQNV